jgi:cobalamin synthase
VILLGIVLIGWGIFTGRGGNERLAAGLIVASLGGGELALREHMAGYRSHTTLLAGASAFVVVTAVALLFGPVRLWELVALAVVVFAASFLGLRQLFKRRSGGLSFR